MSNSSYNSHTFQDGSTVEWISGTLSLREIDELTWQQSKRTAEVTAKHFKFDDKLVWIPTPASPADIQIGGSHYKNLSVQPWSALKSWLTPEEYIGFLRGNIIKYQARAHHKDSFTENLEKAAHYQQELTEFMKGYTPPQK